ncbi:TPA: DUF1627 domain-containing protein [Enterobacter bugandensis]|uniref:DUF1627 domain-containing protein n=1 Tax=Enterobacter bugandensis TaxID=881260 RepID=UPI0020045F7E|nr:DUF1627 domain-containing protein [Enterobacter bugandensis]MCK7115156.1 DUF1627 domain-containing protein [Enterobacter bugandensis]MCK7446039.1 DUF1627 domain-containing protein [Enterobacter bugandensis]HCM9243506.1 DUF1627 domain-containing protein [Enterobacter bugandensis]
METVLDALKAMGKATYRELAARLDIEPVEALAMLREQKEQGLCDFADGGWFIGTAAKQKAKRIRPKQESELVGQILAVMQGQGAISAEKIAKLLGKTSRALNASLGALGKEGRVVRHVDGKNITWSLKGDNAPVPTDAAPVMESSPAESAPAEKSTAQIVEEIPAFTVRPDELVIPSSRFISSEIRRTKAKLASLQKLQGAVRELRRHKHLLVGLRND